MMLSLIILAFGLVISLIVVLGITAAREQAQREGLFEQAFERHQAD